MAEAGLNTRAEVLSPAEGGDVAEYFALMKPRVMFLVVFTALVGLVAAPGHMHPVLAVAALLCIAVGAGAAGALNMWYDADIDARMARTSARPIPRGRITADEARAFGTVLAIGSVICLGLMANWVAAGLLALTIAFYVFVYTMWLKRSTPQNIVIGGRRRRRAADDRLGRGHRHGEPRKLCPVPHHLHVDAAAFLGARALARARLRARRRAHDAGGERRGRDRRQILIYSLILAPLGCVPAIVGLGGGLYTVAAGFLGAFFVMFAYACYSERVGPDAERAAKNLFAYSVLYLFLLFAVLLVEQGFGLGRSSIPLFWTS